MVHYKWVRDSISHNFLQPLSKYLLPAGCSALHGYDIFPVRQAPPDSLIVLGGRGSNGKKKNQLALAPGSHLPSMEGVLTNVRVLNFAGMYNIHPLPRNIPFIIFIAIIVSF